VTTRAHEPYVFYGLNSSYYAGKVRSYLRKKRIPFEEQFVNHPHFKEIVGPKAGNTKLPIIEAPDGTVVQDTTEIIDFLEARHPEPPVYPDGPKQRLVALIFELFGDEGLLKAGLHYRWAFPEQNQDFVLEDFALNWDPTSETTARNFGPPGTMPVEEQVARTGDFMRQAISVLGVDASTAPAIEASYEEFLDLFELHCRECPYLLGGWPSIGDFGLMAPLYGHLSRDPYPSMLMKRRAPSVFRWVERMNAFDSGMAPFPEMSHGFMSDDAIPDTLLPMLKLIAKDYMPELESVLAFMARWIQAHPDFPPGVPIVPGGVTMLGAADPLGMHTVTMRGISIRQVVRYYSQWMFQRVVDHYTSLVESERADVDGLLEETDLRPYLDLPIPRRIERLDNLEVFA